MKRIYALLFPALVLTLMFCSKDEEENPVGPEPGAGNSYRLITAYVKEQLPSLVNVMFQITDMDGKGVEGFALGDFVLLEEGNRVNAATSALQLNTADFLAYSMKTVLMLDVSEGAKIDQIKSAASAFVDKLAPYQSIALFKFADSPVLVKDFSSNIGELKDAINTLTTGSATTDLWGSAIRGLNHMEEKYNPPSDVTQAHLVLFTDGTDTKGSRTLDNALTTRRDQNVYVIALGSGVDAGDLKQLANRKYLEVADESKLNEAFTTVQELISAWKKGFYWMSYITQQRGFANRTVNVFLLDNDNSGEDNNAEGVFASSLLYTMESGLYINWSESRPEGVDSLFVVVGDTVTLQALTVGGQKAPNYTWESDNASQIRIEPLAQGASRAFVYAQGDSGSAAWVTVTDVANNLVQKVRIRLTTFVFGTILREWWVEISGTAITNLTNNSNYPDNPTSFDYPTSFEAPTDWADNYGTRMRGFLHPRVTGDYTFWIASDDASQLWLSTDQKPENAVKICEVTGWTSSRAFDETSAQQSRSIHLIAGRAYYIEALQKEGTGGDNLAVAWRGPEFNREVIDGLYLSPWLLGN